VFCLEGMAIGIQTCWDNMFPEGSRILALKGADAILAPRATDLSTADRWRLMLTANALANGCYVLSANRSGTDGGNRFGGDSFAAGPDGAILAAIRDGDGVVTVTVDPAVVRAARTALPFLQDRRPALYREIVEGPGA
jgi:predicted amidohydrolase